MVFVDTIHPTKQPVMKRNQQTLQVFIVKQSSAISIIKDEVIYLENNRFKSIKFRHTYYDRSDFMTTIDEVKEYLKVKYKYSGELDNLISEI
jgi:hypothetical protein